MFSLWPPYKNGECKLAYININCISLKLVIPRNDSSDLHEPYVKCLACNFPVRLFDAILKKSVLHASCYFTPRECDLTSSLPSSLTSLLRSQRSEKPFHCTLCDKKFSQSGSGNLTQYSRTPERQFHCTKNKRC